MSRILRLLVLIGLLASAGCSSLAPLLSTPTPAPDKQATSTPQSISTQTASPQPEVRVLRVWLPPRFDPNAGTDAANLLKQRFADFESQHPGLKLEIRIKAEDGDTGLLNSLSVTSAAAPKVLPDLIALPRPALESAALKGLLHPTDGLSVTLDAPDWYAYARDLGHFQNIGYGLPFAGDVLVLAYHPDVTDVTTWDNVFTNPNTLAFAAGDPQGIFGLSLYASAGGKFRNDTGVISLDQGTLTRLLTWVEQGISTGTLLPSLKNISTNDDVKKAFDSNNVDAAVTWFSNFPSNDAIAPVPGLSDSTYAFATGWVWSLAGSNPENQQVAVELAEYLAADDFIVQWTRAAGYLPTRASGTEQVTPAVSAIAESAHIIPSNEVVQVLGPLVQDALIRVLNGEQPEVVAGSVIEKLK